MPVCKTTQLKCAVCDSANVSHVYRARARDEAGGKKKSFTPTACDYGIYYDLAKCNDCNLLFSLLDSEEKERIGREYSRSNDPLYMAQTAERTATCRRALSALKPYIRKGGRLLDVGCSYGFFLEMAREYGLETHGVELSEHAVEYCRKSRGLDVTGAAITQAAFPDNYFDSITAIEVIEHIPDPKAFIAAAHKMLRPGGVLYLVTPDTASLSSRLLGYRWWSYRRMHLNYFSKKTLFAFLRAQGFSILNCRPYRKTFKTGYFLTQAYAALQNRACRSLVSFAGKAAILTNIRITASFGDIAVVARKP